MIYFRVQRVEAIQWLGDNWDAVADWVKQFEFTEAVIDSFGDLKISCPPQGVITVPEGYYAVNSAGRFEMHSKESFEEEHTKYAYQLADMVMPEDHL